MLDNLRGKATAAIYGALIVSFGMSLVSCSVGTDDSCLSDLAAHRTSIDADYAAGDESPLSNEQKAKFAGLDYYPGKPKYCIQATFAGAAEGEVFDMPTFNEASIPFREYGTFNFQIDEIDYSLTAYQRMDLPEERRQWVLIPFKDATNGRGTYGGGRYLEVELPIDSSTIIDFNRASNPWCAYDPGYVCPVPPAKNWIKLSIEAGEKSFMGKVNETA